MAFIYRYLVIMCILCGCGFAQDSEFKDEGMVLIPKHVVINQDYFVSGRVIEILGTINGDAYIVGGQVFIDGDINGNVLVLAGSLEITGSVSQNIRVISGQALISGKVGKNVSGLTATMDLSASGVIGGNVVLVSGNTDISSVIDRNLRVYSSNVRLSSLVRGKIKAYVSRLRITSHAIICRGIEYWSSKKAFIDPDAEIHGQSIHHPLPLYNLFHNRLFALLEVGSRIAGVFMNFLYSLIIGCIVLRYFSHRIEVSIDGMDQHPVQAVCAGLVLIVLLPVVMLILLITILGVPFALTLLSLTVIGFYTAKIFALFWVCSHVFKHWLVKKRRFLCFLSVLIGYFLIGMIPYLGVITSVSALLFGFGGVVIGKRVLYKS